MEVEFKFQIPAARLKAVEADMRSAPTVRTRMQARYFDTADGALAAGGVVLRLRKEGRRWVQTAKATGDGPLARMEHNLDMGVARAARESMPDAARHAGTEVGARLQLLLQGAQGPLIETFATDIWRLSRRVQEGASTVELAMDTGRVTHQADGAGPQRDSPVCELELELLDGEIEGLVALGQRWSGRHGLWLSTLSKAERGERLRSGGAQAQPVKAAPPTFDPERLSGPDVQRAVVVACLAQVLPNADEIAAGNDSAEIVHQLRVGIRRLRTALRELAALGRTFDPAWGPALVDVFRALGDQRDRELLLTKMQPRLVRAGAPEIDVPTEDAPDSSVSEVVRAPAFQSTLVALTGFTAGTIQQPADAHEQDAGATRKLLRKRLARLLRDIRRDAEHFQSLTPASQHRVRKRLKRLRYLAEFVAPLFDTRKAKRFIEALEPAQDALGGYNDEIVALEAYRALARSDPKAWFAVGWLTALQDEHVRDAARALGGLRDAPRFWKK